MSPGHWSGPWPQPPGNLEVVRYVDSTMAQAVLGWNPGSSEGAVTATGQGLIDPGLPDLGFRR